MALRIAALYLISTLLLLLALGAGLYLSTERTLIDARRADLQAEAAADAAFLHSAAPGEDDLRTLASVLASVLPAGGGGPRSLRVFSANGTLLAALPPDAAGRGRPSRATRDLLPPGLLAVTQGTVDEPGLIYAAQAITGTTRAGGNGTVGVIEAAGLRADIDRILERLRRGFTLAAALAGLLAAAMGGVLARSVARPVRRLEAVATAIAGGDLTRRATGLPRNEIGALGDSFNAMAARLAAGLAESRAEQARLAALLASLVDGVLACDAAGALTLENPAAREMLGVAHAAPPAAVATAAAAAGIGALWARAMGTGGGGHPGPVEEEITAAGRALLVVAAPLGATGGAVCVLRDITRLRELEQGRTAVFRRLGHELRTPLTALRTVLANLSDTATPAAAGPLATAEAEAERLSRLVDEILAVGQGRATAPLAVRPTDLATLVAGVCALFVGRAGRLGVALAGPDAAGAAVIVRGDPDRLRQVLVNLLDNALRHTPPGGQIRISVAVTDGHAVLQVADTGEGMDAATGRWAFAPYYQGSGPAGDAPAPPAGPTRVGGLGLAIVREIVTAHGGTVGLDSTLGMGTTVTVQLPLATAPSPP